MRGEQPKIEALGGLWRRALIAWPDGRRDAASAVCWLQGPRLYADLRQPPHRPGFRSVRSLRDFAASELDWLASQEGFAGDLSCANGIFEWHRDIDFQPPTACPDRGRLRFEHDMLIEDGERIPYVEHWRRAPVGGTPIGALRLFDEAAGCRGTLLRVGDIFMYARDRAAQLPGDVPLRSCVAGARSLAEAQDLVDCEISQGRVSANGWVIERSSLPYREGARLDPEPGGSDTCRTCDADRDGRPMIRHWRMLELEGAADAFLR